MGIKNIFVLLILTMSWSAIGQQVQVKRGPRKTLNLSTIPVTAFYPGKVIVKLKEDYAGRITSGMATNNDSLSFGISRLDRFTATLKLIRKTKSFQYEPGSNPNAIKHSAWGFDRWFTLEFPPGTDIKAAIASLRQMTDIIEVAEPSFKRVLFDNNDPVQLWTPLDSAYYRQWNFNHTAQEGPTSPEGTDADIDLPEAWDLEKGKPEVIVALFDGGIDTSHPELRPNLWVGAGNERFGFNWYSGSPQLQANPHGTHTCGIIAAKNNNDTGISGIAGGDGSANSGVRIMNMQIFNSNGTIYAGDEAAANAFIYSADRGAAIAQNSWGGGSTSTLLLDAIDYFIMNGGGKVLNGGVVVFSAGNGNAETQNFPGGYPPVICVAATNYDDKKSWYSSYGSWIDITAPGGELNAGGGASSNGGRKGILSTLPVASGSLYGWNHGTSMACPHVSGVAALCVSKAMGKLTNEQLREILLKTADDISALNPSFSGKLGSGRVNAFQAVKHAALIAGSFVDSVTGFQAAAACGTVKLTWNKNAAGNSVIIAESDSLLFGTPSGPLQVDDQLPGGGKIIYKGGEEILTRQIPTNKRKYYRIWSYSGSNYAFHRTVSAIYRLTVSIPVLTSKDGCDIQVDWEDNLTCGTDSVLLLAGNHTPFATPSGILNMGDTLPGGAYVIYKGRGNSFLYTTEFDSTVYIQKWNFNSGHDYTNADGGNYDFIRKANSIASVSPSTLGERAIRVAWQANETSCAAGNRYLLAYSTDGAFGFPSGNYAPGVQITGGGTVLFSGTDTTFSHENLTPNTGYCYRVWKINSTGQYSSGKQACGKTFCENALITLPFGYGFNGDDGSSPDLCRWDIINGTALPDPLLIVGTSNNPTAKPLEGTGMLRFNAYNVQKDQSAVLQSRAIKKGIGKSLDVRFRWYQDSSNYTGVAYADEGVTVQWSTDRLTWKNLEYYPRVPVQGLTGWSYKQLTLPESSYAADTVYLAFLFTSAFGNNCYLDDLKMQVSTYKSSDGVTQHAVAEFTDSTTMWTHYYDANGGRLLSVKKNGNKFGKAGLAGFDLIVGGDADASIIPFTGNSYVLNSGSWVSMNRYYRFSPLNAATDSMQLQFYFTGADVSGLAAKAATIVPPVTGLTPEKLYAYRIGGIDTAYDADPRAGHINIPQAAGYNGNGFFLYQNGALPDTSHWKFTDHGNQVYSFTYPVIQPGSGGLGIGTATTASALPVQWLSFKATPNQNQAVLTWRVINERQVKYYEVEYSTDGSSFTTLGQVDATPGSGEKEYRYIHILPKNGLNYYRIREVDRNNRNLYSSIAELNFSALSAVVVRPNPVTNTAIIQTGETMKELVVFDLQGRQMILAKPGNRQYELNTESWPAGIYLLKILTESGGSSYEKIVKEKR